MHGYVTVGFYPDGSPGEVFIKIAKEGTYFNASLQQCAMAWSYMLQAGYSLAFIVERLRGHKIEDRDRSIFDVVADALETAEAERAEEGAGMAG